MNKKHILLLFILLLIIVVLVFSCGYKKELVSDSNNEEKIIPKKLIDTSNWNEYINNQLGFSIKIPQKVFTIGHCQKDQNFATLKILDDSSNKTVYILEDYYKTNDNGECIKVDNSLESVQKQIKELKEQGYYPSPYLGWSIIVNDINSEEDILKYLKNSFGSGCYIENKSLQGDGNYDIRLKGERNNEEDPWWGNCPLNFAYKIIFSKEKNKLMSVVLGQECKFQSINPELSDPSYECYDEEMIKTFKFQ
jgi:hypothetical protein